MKKTKLLLSLAMMCLSIAVLCFGVLAATSVTYSISGTISYEVKDVFVKINTSVYAIAEQQDKATVITTVKAMESVSQAKTLTINSKTYTRTQEMVEYDSSNATTDPATHTAQTSESEGVKIVYGGDKGYYTYYIVINIQNLSSSKEVDAIITDKTEAELNSIKTTNLYQNNIASTQAKNIVIAYSIKDKTQGIDSTAAEISYSLKVSYETTDYTNPIEVTKDETNSYYYVTLGTGKVLTGTSSSNEGESSNIKWRLVSLDGMSKYTYNSSDEFEIRYLSDAVFLQETMVNVRFAHDSEGNYFNAEGRKTLKDGSCFNITNLNDLSFVKARKIDKINYWTFTGSIQAYYDSTKEPILNNDDSRDSFWLLSCEEVTEFLGDTNEVRKWMNVNRDGSAGYFLRTPLSYRASITLGTWACHVYSFGSMYNIGSDIGNSGLARAAFQVN